MGKNNEDHLKGKILFFSPNDEGASYFTDSLIYMCDHNSNGSLTRFEISLKALLFVNLSLVCP